MIFGLSL